jgi:hypothetical protein
MNTVIIKAKSGFLANTTEKNHRAFKTIENGNALYEVHYAGSRVFLSADMVEEIAPVETYWFVKSVSTATPENPSFAGKLHTYIFGKEEYTLFEDVPGGFYNVDLTNCPGCIVEYGYKRFSDAKRSYHYKNPQNDWAWRTTVEIVSLDVQKDADGVYHVV